MNDLSPAQTIGLTEWRRIATTRDWDAFAALLTEDVEYHNPAALEPIRGHLATVATFRAVFSVMENFAYLRDYRTENGVALEFDATVLGDTVYGIDLIDFDDSGHINKFTVMMRPAPTVLTLASEAIKRATQNPADT